MILRKIVYPDTTARYSYGAVFLKILVGVICILFLFRCYNLVRLTGLEPVRPSF